MSFLKDALKRQIDSSGTLLLKGSSTLADEEFFSGNSDISMAWTLGHLAALQDWSINRVFRQRDPKLSREKREALKGGRAITADDRASFNQRSELEDFFSNTQYETISLLHNFDEAEWGRSTPSGCRFPTFGALWEHLAVHNHWHLGQMATIYPKLAQSLLLAPRFYSVDPDEMN